MTVSNPTRLVTFTGNGVTTSFPFTFLIPTDTAVVTLTTISTGVEGAALTQDVDYTITGEDDENGGTITYPISGSPLAATHKINIKSILTPTQTLDLTTQSAYNPNQLELQLDRMTLVQLQLTEQLERALLSAPGSTLTGEELLAALSDAVVDASAYASSASGYATAAEASATAAAASAIAAAASAASLTPFEQQVVAATAKTTPVDADLIGLVETTGPTPKKVTWLQAWTNYFKVKADAVYQALKANLTSLGNLSIVAGDIVYGSAADTFSRLAKGTDGQFLTLASGVPSWSSVSAGPTLLTEQATTSGTTKDFTIPAGAKRITVMFDGVSFSSGSQTIGVQLGDSGGIETTGYVSTAGSSDFTDRIPITNISAAGSEVHSGMLILTRMNDSHKWLGMGIGNRAQTTVDNGFGVKTLSAELTTVRLMGATFDAGSVNVMYE